MAEITYPYMGEIVTVESESPVYGTTRVSMNGNVVNEFPSRERSRDLRRLFQYSDGDAQFDAMCKIGSMIFNINKRL